LYCHETLQIVAKCDMKFLGAGWLLMGRYRFSNVVCAYQETDLVRAFFFQVAEGAGMATRK
jgi:hypothetical protein